jgi:hypothetical protein
LHHLLLFITTVGSTCVSNYGRVRFDDKVTFLYSNAKEINILDRLSCEYQHRDITHEADISVKERPNRLYFGIIKISRRVSPEIVNA